MIDLESRRRCTRWVAVAIACALVSSVTRSAKAVDRTAQLRSVALSDEPFSLLQPETAYGGFAREVINAAGNVAFMSSWQDNIYITVEQSGQRRTTRTSAGAVGDLFLMNDDTVLVEARTGPDLRETTSLLYTGSEFIRPTEQSNLPLVANPAGPFVLDVGRAELHTGVLPGEGTTLVRRVGDSAPGVSDESRFAETSAFSEPRINRHGHIVFSSELEGPFVDENNLSSIWLSRDGELSMLYRDGEDVPGLEPGERFGALYHGIRGIPTLNDQDDVAFISAIRTSQGTRGLAIFAHRNGELEIVVEQGQSIPGAGSLGGMTLSDVTINNQGQVAFRTFLGGQNAGMFVEQPDGEINLLAVHFGPVPGVGESQFLLDRAQPFQFNNRGQLAFSSEYRVNGEVFQGAFASTPDGQLKPLVLPGDTIEVSPGDQREVERARMNAHNSGNADGLPSVMNDNGEVLVYVRFTDGTSGLFVSDLVRDPLVPSLVGDFNQNQVLDADDVDILAQAIRDESASIQFDVNQDGIVDIADHTHWLTDLKMVNHGDADMNGRFESTDLILTFRSGLYESTSPATWESGDWDGDGRFTTGDLTVAFATGSYQSSATPVPEPTTLWLFPWLLGSILFVGRGNLLV